MYFKNGKMCFSFLVCPLTLANVAFVIFIGRNFGDHVSIPNLFCEYFWARDAFCIFGVYMDEFKVSRPCLYHFSRWSRVCITLIQAKFRFERCVFSTRSNDKSPDDIVLVYTFLFMTKISHFIH